MKNYFAHLIATLAVGIAAPSAMAVSGNWTNNASSVWSAATNWNSNPTVPGTVAGDTVGLTFDITTARTVTIDTTSRTIGTLNIGDPTSTYAAYTLAASGGASLTFNNSGSGALLAKPAVTNTALDVISAPVVLADNLTIDTAVTNTGNSGLSLSLTGVISESGTRSLTKNGAGGVRLDGANTFSGGTILNAGELQVGSAASFFGLSTALGTGTLTVNGGKLAARNGAKTITNAVSVAADFTVATLIANNAVTLSGAINLNGGLRTISVENTASDPDSTFSGNVSNGSLTKAGAGNLELTNAFAYTGDTRIAAGNLMLSGTSGANLSLANSTLDMNTADAGTMSFRGSAGTVAATFGGLKGSRNLNLANTLGSAVALTVGNNGQSTTYSGVLSGAAGASLTKIGAGTLILSGANTYDGSTTINGGSLQLGDGGSTGSLNASGLIQDNANLTINRNNTVTQGTDFGGGSIAGTGSFTQAGTGTTILNLGNSYSGATTVSAGKLVVSSDQSSTGAASVANGAALGITTSSGQWAPATLTLGTSTSCTLEFNSIANAGTATAPLNPGSVTRNANVTVNVTSISGAIAVGGSGYPLLGNMSGSTNGYSLGTQPLGVSGHLGVSGSTLTYVVDTVSDIWLGTDPINPTFWNVATTANWGGKAANNIPANTFANGDVALFNDSGSPTVSVQAAVTPAQVLVVNSTVPYDISSSGANNIGGSGGLTKSGSGSLSLSGPNTYSGGTTLSAGQLNINDGGSSSANSAIGTGPLTIIGGTLDITGAGDVTLLPNNAQNWNGDFTYGGSFGYNLNLGTGAVTPSGNRQITVNASTLTVGGVIGGGAASLTKAGAGTLTLSGASTFSGGATLSAGQLNINNGGSSSGNSAVGTGPLTISGGTTIDNTSGGNVTLLPNNPQVWAGSFTYSGSANNLNLGTGAVNLGSSTRTVTVSANTLTVGGVVSGTGGLNKAGVGTLVLSAANTFSGQFDFQAGTLVVGNNQAAGTGSLQFNNGVTIQSADSTARTITNALLFNGVGANVTFGGAANLTFTGPLPANQGSDKTLTVNNSVTEFAVGGWGGASGRIVAGTGKLIFSGAQTYTLATTISPGATLQLGNGGATGGVSPSSAIANEGTLIFNRSNSVVQGVDFGSAAITGSGPVVQAGTGTTTLNAANTYVGATTVSGGKLLFSTTGSGMSSVTVASSATAGVVQAAVGGSWTNSADLTQSAGSALEVDFSSFIPSTSVAPMVVANFSSSATTTVRVKGILGNFTIGQAYPLLTWIGVGPINTNAFALTPPAGLVGHLSISANTLKFVADGKAGEISWNTGNGIWDTNAVNWIDATMASVKFVNGSNSVIFGDASGVSGNPVVTLTNTLSPVSVTINSASHNYTITGTGGIAGSGALQVKNGTLTNATVNSYNAGTVVSGGTLQISGSGTMGDASSPLLVSGGTVDLGGTSQSVGAVTLTSGNIQNGTLTNTSFSVSNTSALTLNLVLAGSGGVTKTGNGILILTNANTYSGKTFVNAGTVSIDAGSCLGAAPGGTVADQLTLDGGALKMTGSFTFAGTRGITVGSNGGIIDVDTNQSVTYPSLLAGSTGVVTKNGEGTIILDFGAADHTYGGLILNAGAVGFRKSTGLGIGEVLVNGGQIYNSVAGQTRLPVNSVVLNGNLTLGNSNVAGGITFSGSWTITNASRTLTVDTNGNTGNAGLITISGAIGEDVAGRGLTKAGAGILLLGGANTYSGPTIINGGSLVVDGSTASGAVTINSSGRLNGIGTVGGAVTVNSGGTLSPGDPSSIGTLTVTGNLTLQAGSTSQIQVDGTTPANDSVTLGGNVTYGGTLNILTSGSFTLGQQFTLFSGTGATNASNFASIAGSPGTGLAFNFTNGVLSVVSGPVGPPGPQYLTNSFSGGVLTLTWPSGQGWRLVGQTNALSSGLNNAWFDVPGGIDGSISITINPANPTVFYRLAYP